MLRRAYADACNDVLQAGGHERRLDPDTYAQMGVDQEPALHLGSTEARLVAVGVATETDRLNEARSYAGERRRRFFAIDQEWEASRDQLAALSAQGNSLDQADAERGRLVATIDGIAADRKALVEVEMLHERARSRALSVDDYCGRVLGQIAGGRASRADENATASIERRRRSACHHLAEIEEAVAPWQHEMEAARRDLEERSAGLRAKIATFARSLEKSVELACVAVLDTIRETKSAFEKSLCSRPAA